MARAARRWVRHVQETSNAMDLPQGIFMRSPRGIAAGLKQAVTKSRRTKGRSKFQSAMSMLNLHVNRAGRNLGRADRVRLEAAKRELRRLFGRETPRRRTASARHLRAA
jgi:Protein of unknown function (DUF3175)